MTSKPIPTAFSKTLPIELYTQIVSYIPIENTKTLLSCLLVNKALFRIISKRLYQHITFSSHRDRSPFYDLTPLPSKSSGALQKFRAGLAGSIKGYGGKSRKQRQLDFVEVLEIEGPFNGYFLLQKAPILPKIHTLIYNFNQFDNLSSKEYDLWSKITFSLPLKKVIFKSPYGPSSSYPPKYESRKVDHLILVYTDRHPLQYPFNPFNDYTIRYLPTKYLDIVFHTQRPQIQFQTSISSIDVSNIWHYLLRFIWDYKSKKEEIPLIRFVNLSVALEGYTKQKAISAIEAGTELHKEWRKSFPEYVKAVPEQPPAFQPPNFRVIEMDSYLVEIGPRMKEDIFTKEEMRFWGPNI